MTKTSNIKNSDTDGGPARNTAKAADLRYPASTHFLTAGSKWLSVTGTRASAVGTVGVCLQTERSSGSKP